jgi:hypothetical protein
MFVLERLSHIFQSLVFHEIQSSSVLPRIVATSVLEALVVFSDFRGTNTDINPTTCWYQVLTLSHPRSTWEILATYGVRGKDIGRLISSVYLPESKNASTSSKVHSPMLKACPSSKS